MYIDYNNPVVLISNVIIYALGHGFAYLILTPKYKPSRTAFWSLLNILVFFRLPVLLENYPMLKAVLGITSVFWSMFFLYSDTLRKKIIVMTLVGVATLLGELASVLTWYHNLQVSYLFLYSVIIATEIMALSIFAFLYFRLPKNSERRVQEREWAVMMVVFYSQWISLLGWIRYATVASRVSSLKEDTALTLVIVVTLALLADYLFFKSMKRTVAAARLEVENAALSRQVTAQEKYYTGLEKQFTAIRQIRHDISNHLYTIRSLLSEGKHEEAERYAGDYLSSVSEATGQRLCEEPSVNAFLLYRQEELQNAGIKTDFAVSLAPGTGISSVDYVTALGNLLDNAEEACRGISESRIILRVRSENGWVMITEENPSSPQESRAERIPGLSRGAGFTILQNIAEKYGGSFTYENCDGLFRCAVSLKL